MAELMKFPARENGPCVSGVGKTVWSFSRLELFADWRYGCPRRYYYKYVERRPEPPTPALERGRIVHAVIAACLRETVEPEAALDWVPGAESLDEDGRTEVLSLARGYLDAERPCGTSLVEEKLTGYLEGEAFVGYADLVELGDPVVLTDFKTSWERFGPLDTWQLPLYGWMFAERTGVRRLKGRLWFLRYHKEPYLEAEIGPDEMKAARDWARKTVAEIKAAEKQPLWSCFPPRPGSACSGCGFAPDCLGLPPVGEMQPEELGGAILRLERALEVCRKQMEEAVASGPVQVGRQHFGMYARSRWVFPDVAAFCTVLEREGKDPWKYLEAPGWKLGPLLRSQLGAMIRELGQELKEIYLTHRDKPPEAV